jgi:hypothetical protein
VIVTINAWICFLGGLGALWQFPEAVNFGERIAAVFGFVSSLALWWGLLKRRSWGRWLAIGVSLITWTGGILALGWFVDKGIKFYRAVPVVPSRVVVVFLVSVAIMGVGLWLAFKLFDYLTTDEAREEFDSPPGERYVVAKSTAVYLGFLAVILVLAYRPAPPGIGVDLETLAASREKKPAGSAAPTAPDPSAQTSQPSLDGEANAQLAYEQRQQAMEAARQQRMAEQQRAREARRGEELRDPASGNTQILRCRDSSGEISFTQGYCPDGTQQVGATSD